MGEARAASVRGGARPQEENSFGCTAKGWHSEWKQQDNAERLGEERGWVQRHHLHGFGGAAGPGTALPPAPDTSSGQGSDPSLQLSAERRPSSAGRAVLGAAEQISERFPRRLLVSSLLLHQPTSSIWSRNVFFTAFQTAWEIKPQHSPVLLQSGNPALLEEAAGTRSRAQPPPFSFFLAPQHLAPHPPSPGKEPAKEIKNETKRKGINRLPVPWQYKHQWQRPHVQYSNLINK